MRRFWPGFRIVVIGTMFFMSASLLRADDEALRRRVLSEYPPALAVLETAYAGFRAEARVKSHTNIGLPSERRSSTQTNYAMTGERMRIITDGWADPATEPANSSAVKHPDTVVSCTPSLAFKLTRSASGSPYIISYAGDKVASYRNSLGAELGKTGRAATHLLAIELSRFMKLKGFSITDVRAAEADDGRKLIEVAFNFDKQGPQSAGSASVKRGTFLLSPDEGWVVRGYELKFTQPFGWYNHVGRIEYDSGPGSVPVPRRVLAQDVVEILDPSKANPKRNKPGVRNEEVIEFTRFALGPVPDGEFELAAFGLPDVTRPGIPERPRSWTSFILIGAGMAGLAIVFIVRHFLGRTDRRRERQAGEVSAT